MLENMLGLRSQISSMPLGFGSVVLVQATQVQRKPPEIECASWGGGYEGRQPRPHCIIL